MNLSLSTSSAPRAHRRPPTALFFALAASVALAACGGGDGDGDGDEATADSSAVGSAAVEPIDGITVIGEFGEEPTVEIDRPFEATEASTSVLVDGEGEELATGDLVSVDFFVTDGTTGDQEQSSHGAEPVELSLEEGTANPALLDALVGATVNDRLLVVLPPETPPEGQSVPPDSLFTAVFVIDVLAVLPPPLSQAEGEEVAPAEGLPTVETDEGGAVTGITVPTDVPAPTELSVTTLIEGEGEPVEADDTLTVQYTGVLYDDGTVFDSSWERGEPASFPLTGVIPGWQQGLEGVPVGSRVLLVVPAELGYGDAGQPPSIPGGATLVFVVDVLAAR